MDRIAHHARTSDLVIMGIRGTTEDTHPGQGGGHLDGVLSSIVAPVLFVTRDHRTVRGVALGYDGSDGAARALRAAETVAGPLKLPLHAIFISADGTGGEVLDEAVRAYPDINVQKHVVVGEEPHTAMAKAAVAEGANLLAIGFRGRSQLKDFLYGSSCDFILMNTDLMVLVAR